MRHILRCIMTSTQAGWPSLVNLTIAHAYGYMDIYILYGHDYGLDSLSTKYAFVSQEHYYIRVDTSLDRNRRECSRCRLFDILLKICRMFDAFPEELRSLPPVGSVYDHFDSCLRLLLLPVNSQVLFCTLSEGKHNITRLLLAYHRIYIYIYI